MHKQSCTNNFRLYKDQETHYLSSENLYRPLQILHDRGNHLVASNIGCPGNTINLYDMLFSDASDGTRKVIENIFKATNSIAINMVNIMGEMTVVYLPLLSPPHYYTTAIFQVLHLIKMRQSLSVLLQGTFTLTL